MSHNHKPINHSIGTLSFPHIRQLQVLKIPVIEKQSFVVIEGDSAPSLIIKNVYTVPLHSENLCTIQQNQPKGGQRRGIRLHEILNRIRRAGDKSLR